MLSARQSAVRLLQLMMIASIILPAVLFAFGAKLNYSQAQAAADERIERSLDILHEHALKVFQTVERAIAEVDEMLRGLSDQEIREQEPRIDERLQQIVAEMPQLQDIFILDRNGARLAGSFPDSVPGATRADRSYFQAQAQPEAGTYVSEALTPRAPRAPRHIFDLSRRRPSADGSFTGVTAGAVRPDYFEEFYSRIGQAPGSYYSMIRNDGAVLARYPPSESGRQQLDMRTSGFAAATARDPDFGLYTTAAQLDGIERRLGYRKLVGFPVYVMAGIETSAIQNEWLSSMSSHLIFGAPATLLIFSILWLALGRTRRLHDEAERRETAEAALRQAQRLEAIGQLTGGVAHDFNNLLMIVSGNVDRLRRELTGEKHRRCLDMITTATQRGESLTRQLLAFSRRQTLTPAVIDLRRRLPEFKELLGRSLRGDIETEVVVPNESCAIKVDPGELELALINLAVNARDAMPNGGTLSISAHPVLLKGEPAQEGLRGDFVALRVADSGTGIPQEVLPHVFEPFFTTKPFGKGTGLGLSQVYGFARQSGGTATVATTLGQGTVISLYLPRSTEIPAPAVAQPHSAAVLRRAGKALLVEDNAEVADVCHGYLRQLGYEVRRAESAQEALEVLENEPGIDLVFSDILMPGLMNGLDLAKSVRDRFPRLPVLLTTGYSSSAQEAVREGFVVLGKPFDFTGLEKKLGEAMRVYAAADAPKQKDAVV
ncbi:MAG TPA: ATP-binding protein [Xanthobacteraceae bacterium]|jgi:two-component system NtrC family sensor kinase